MNKWDDYYKIVMVDNFRDQNGSYKIYDLDEPYYLYQLHDPSGVIVATYKDPKYAKKQAKYKFRKLQAKLEKILLT